PPRPPLFPYTTLFRSRGSGWLVHYPRCGRTNHATFRLFGGTQDYWRRFHPMSTQLKESQDQPVATDRPFTGHPVIARPTAWLRAQSMGSAIRMGLIGSVILTLCSYTVGATRERGGIVQALGLDWLAFGHMAGIFSVVFWVGIALLVLSWAIVGGLVLRGGHALPQRAIAAWIGPMVLAAPLMSRDIYSYLMQGALAKEGLDAYRVGAAANPGPMLYEVSADWRNTTTPYGPGHLWLGKGVTTIT